MKKINATTTYNPNLSTMQEIEYTMPQAKKDIANCLMNALDNLKDQQVEIDKLVELIEAGMEANRSSNPVEWHRWFKNAEKCLEKHRGK